MFKALAVGMLLMMTALASGGDVVVTIETEDGARLAVKRKAAQGTPVIFLHGLAVNGDIWNLPEIRTEEFHYRSLAQMLHERGHDIWLVTLRGLGGEDFRSMPPSGQDDWCVDHFVLYDLPAVVQHVRKETGRKPFVVGSSMGSMALAGYVQGARLRGEGNAQRIIADLKLAAQRQQELAGCVFTEFPAALRWPSSAYDERGRLDWQRLVDAWWQKSGDTNLPFELAARADWLRALVAAAGEVPLSKIRGNSEGERWYQRLPERWRERAAELELRTTRLMLSAASRFTGAVNHRAEVTLHGRRYAFDDMKAGVLTQLAKCVRQGAFVSELGVRDHVYSEHYESVVLPVLVVQGGRDRIANHEVTRAAFYDRIRSQDKMWLFDVEIAHGEIQAAPVACERLYPKMVQWIAERSDSK